MNDKLHPLRIWRDERGMSRRGLADKLGVSEMSVWRWESGQLLPKRGHWAMILKVTGIRPEAFIPFVLTGVGYDR